MSGNVLNFNELMEIENQQTHSVLSTPENNPILFGATSNFGIESIGVRTVSSLLEGAFFIVSHGTYEIGSIAKQWHRPLDLVIQKFDGLSKLIPTTNEFFYALVKTYGDLFDIHLHLIVYDGSQYICIDETSFGDPNEPLGRREHHAFIWCPCDTTICAPLYTTELLGKITTVFETGDLFIWQDVLSFVAQLNEKLVSNQNQMGQSWEHLGAGGGDLTISDTTSTILSTQGNEAPPPIIGTPQEVIGKMLQEIMELMSRLESLLNGCRFDGMIAPLNNQTTDPWPPESSAALIQERLSVISDMVQMAIEQNAHASTVAQNVTDENGSRVPPDETNDSIQTHLNCGDTRPAILIDIPDTAQVLPTATSILVSLAPPVILVGPKPEWDYRSMNDLSKNEIPLLNGVGRQRVPIQVEVPPRGSDPMFLGVESRTIADGEHPSKIVVPKGTYVDGTSFTKDNDLSQLRFDKCSEGGFFDSASRRAYLRISSEEHEALKKDVLIHMFNLYQSGPITKQLISDEHLEQCVLVFRFYVLKNGAYEPISESSVSNTITEAKKHTHSSNGNKRKKLNIPSESDD